MSEEVANRLLQVTVAQLLLPIGWSSVTNTSLQVLGDVVKRYIEGLGRITSGYAELGKTIANLQCGFLVYGMTMCSMYSLHSLWPPKN